MIFKRNKKKNIIPPKRSEVLTVHYTPEEAAILLECCDFTLGELERMSVKNREAHGALYTETELNAIHSSQIFCAKHVKLLWNFVMDDNYRRAEK